MSQPREMTAKDALKQLADLADEALIGFIIELTEQILRVGQEGGAATNNYQYGQRNVYVKIYDKPDSLAKLAKMMTNNLVLKGGKDGEEEENQEEGSEEGGQEEGGKKKGGITIHQKI